MVFMENTIVLTDSERLELSQRAASRSGRADDARRARLLLLLEANHTWAAIRDKLDCNDAFINRGANAFVKSGWPGCSAGTRAKRPAR
jgi:hypothetical protein